MWPSQSPGCQHPTFLSLKGHSETQREQDLPWATEPTRDRSGTRTRVWTTGPCAFHYSLLPEDRGRAQEQTASTRRRHRGQGLGQESGDGASPSGVSAVPPSTDWMSPPVGPRP